MVSIMRRMRRLKAKLLGIRIGPGAAILSREVTRIHMDFAMKMNGGHLGPRKFWRTCLPRLKYHNPAVPITINRTTDQDGPAVMTIHFADPTTVGNALPAVSSTKSTQSLSVAASESTPVTLVERKTTINMKHKNVSEILSQLLSVTKAAPVKPTEEELEQLKGLEEQQRLSEQDSTRHQAFNEERRRREGILAQARGEVEAVREA